LDKTLSFRYFLNDLQSSITFSATLENDRITAFTSDLNPTQCMIYLRRDIEPSQQSIPYPDQVQAIDQPDVYLAEIIAVEFFNHLSIPDYARYARILILELSRLHNHFAFFSSLGLNLNFDILNRRARRDQNRIGHLLKLIEASSSLNTFLRIGGISRDLPTGFIEKLESLLKLIEKGLPFYQNQLQKNYILINQLMNIGPISAELAEQYNLSGPNLRAAGLSRDGRLQELSSYYNRIQFQPANLAGINTESGDAWCRCWIRYLEIIESIQIICQVINLLINTEPHFFYNYPITKKDFNCDYSIEGVEGTITSHVLKRGHENCFLSKHLLPVNGILQILPVIATGLRISSLGTLLSSLNLNSCQYFQS
jgi:NADH-quinone oxidoreductase subunit D